MFAGRYYNARSFAPRYFAKVGAANTTIGRVRVSWAARRPSLTGVASRPVPSFSARRPSPTFEVIDDAE